jgi:hypothetical protein
MSKEEPSAVLGSWHQVVIPNNAVAEISAQSLMHSFAAAFREAGYPADAEVAAGQFQDGVPQSRGQSPRHGPPAVAVMHPIDAVGTIALLEPLRLPLTQLQQTGSFAYA